MRCALLTVTSSRAMYIFFFSLLLFFECYRARRDLPSFPTRRSSDLQRRERHQADARPEEVHDPFHRELLGLRSEEHTSELQSHSDLVCRLLLEKKKSMIIEHIKRQREREAAITDGHRTPERLFRERL